MADFFEFDESDIIFSDDYSDTNQSSNSDDFPSISRSILSRSNFMKEQNCSVPVNIPEISNPNTNSNCSSFGYDVVEFDAYFSDEDDDDDQIVPPHVIVDRRSSDFDSYEKNARGRNLIHVRNSILKLTGFLES